MAEWSQKAINDSQRITNKTANLNRSKFSKSTQIISSVKDKDTGETIRRIWTETSAEKQTNSLLSITTILTRFNLIAVSLLVMAVYDATNDFTIQDLKITTPNYGERNTFIPVEADDINYIQYGNGVVDRVVGFVLGLGQFGTQAQNFWDGFGSFIGLNTDTSTYTTETRSFDIIFTQARWDTIIAGYETLANPNQNWTIYQTLTTDERNYFNTTNPKYWGGYYTSNYDKPTNYEVLPFHLIRRRWVAINYTSISNNTYYLVREVPSVLQHIRGIL